MKYNKTEGKYIFETSKLRLNANCGIIGLSPDLKVYDGYDSDFDCINGETLTKEEKIELADYIINQWTKFKKKSSKNA